MYSLKHNCALWQVTLKLSGIVQFSSLSRLRCLDWLEANTPQEDNDAQ